MYKYKYLSMDFRLSYKFKGIVVLINRLMKVIGFSGFREKDGE
jgi:hypothetical protein